MKKNDFLFLLLVSLISCYLLYPLFSTGLSAPSNDQAQHYWPQRHFSKEQLIKGELPLWNPYIFGGVPHLANPQAAVFYPLSILFYFFSLPRIFFWFIGIHLVFLGMSFYLFLRQEKFSSAVSCLLSTSLTFSSFIVYQIPAGHPISLSGYFWVFLILLLLSSSQEKIIPLILAIVSFYLSGHLQIFFIGLLLISIYTLINKTDKIKYLLVATILAVFLAAFQILPGWEFVSQTTKLSWSALANSYSLDFNSLTTMLLPVKNVTITSYFFEKYNLYFGILPFLLFLITLPGFSRNKQTLSALILIITGLIISFGPKLFFYNWLFKSPFTYFRVPARFYFLTLAGILLLLGENIRHRNSFHKFLPLLTLLTIFDLILWQKSLLKPLPLPPPGSIRFNQKNVRIFTDEELFINKSIMLHQFNLNGYDALVPNYFIQNHYQAVLSGMPAGTRHVFPVTCLAINKLNDFFHPLVQQWKVNYFLTTRLYDDKKITPTRQKDIFIYSLFASTPVFAAKQIFPVNDLLEYSLLDKIDKSVEKICYVLNAEESLPGFTNGEIFTKRLDILPQKIIWEGKITGFVWLVFSQPFYSGWQAYAWQNNYWQKIPVYRGNRVLRVLAIDSRQSPTEKIIQVYYPVSFYFGLIVSLLTVIVLLAYFLLSKRFIDNNYSF